MWKTTLFVEFVQKKITSIVEKCGKFSKPNKNKKKKNIKIVENLLIFCDIFQ